MKQWVSGSASRENVDDTDQFMKVGLPMWSQVSAENEDAGGSLWAKHKQTPRDRAVLDDSTVLTRTS